MALQRMLRAVCDGVVGPSGNEARRWRMSPQGTGPVRAHAITRARCRLCRLAATLDVVTDASAVFEVAEPDRQKLAALAAGGNDRPVAVRTDAGEIELPSAAGRAVLQLLGELGAGAAVHLVPTDTELTTQQSADLLGISRTYLIRLIEDGKLPAHLVGTHRRLRAGDVLDYRDRRTAKLAAVDAIADADAEVGINYR